MLLTRQMTNLLLYFRASPFLVIVMLTGHTFAATSTSGVALFGSSLVSFSLIAMSKAQTVPKPNFNINAWTGLDIRFANRVVDSHTLWVDQDASNLQLCIRMCWLFHACVAVTFNSPKQRCILHRSDGGSYRTVMDPYSIAVDLRYAKMTQSKVNNKVRIISIGSLRQMSRSF